MKRILYLILLLLFQVPVLSAKEGKVYELGCFQLLTNVSILVYEDGQLGDLHIGVNDYVVEGMNVIQYRNALIQLRNKYAEWIRIASENDVKDLRKEVDIRFPNVKSHYYDYIELRVDITKPIILPNMSFSLIILRCG